VLNITSQTLLASLAMITSLLKRTFCLLDVKLLVLLKLTSNLTMPVFTLVDVGGQRSERKKWLHCFNSVTAVIFLTAINEYDMVLEEDTSTNRLLESLKLWKALTSSQFFKSTPFILFLNKSDLFQDKIQKVPLGDIFSDFDAVAASADFANLPVFEKSWKYILRQFKSHFEGYTFYPHLTNVLDTELCKKVFIVVQDTVVKEALKASHLV